MADPTPPPLPATSTPSIRVVTIGSIQESIDKALAALPADAKGAVVAYADRDQAKLAVMGRVGDNWTFVGTLDKPYSGELTVSAEIRYAWK